MILDCADVCATTARVLSRQTTSDGGTLRAVLEACATACRVCAEACRRCERACQEMLTALS
jgi:hypothetical protein